MHACMLTKIFNNHDMVVSLFVVSNECNILGVYSFWW